MKKAFIIIFLFTVAVNAQNTPYSKIERIDSLISSIPVTMVKAHGFGQIETSGPTFKKSWIFFKKRVGSFHEMIIYKDEVIYLIRKTTKNRKGVFLEKYYYENNKLVKYVKEVPNSEDELDLKTYHLYFDDNQIINEVPEENFDIEALMMKSISLNKSWLATINQSNHYF